MPIPKRQAWRSKAKTKPRGPSDETVALLRARSGGVCEICGVVAAVEIHHRKFRSRGGTHELTNLLHVCGWGNHTGCHGRAHSPEGTDNGWSVHAWQQPDTVPVLRPDGCFYIPTDDGSWIPADQVTPF